MLPHRPEPGGPWPGGWVCSYSLITWVRPRPRIVYAWTGGVGAAFVIVVGTAGFMGWNYVQHDNGFCTGCHVMGPAFVKFTESEHNQLECHDCHNQPLTASMRQLYLWVAERPEEIGEHAPAATEVCARCHIQEDASESWEAIAATQGHQVHLMSDSSALAEVQCVTCHAPGLHRFAPAAAAAAFVPAHLGEKADAFAPAPILGVEGDVIGIAAFGLVGLVLLCVPFLDRPKSADARPSKLWTYLTFGARAYILLLTYLGYTFDPTA